MKKKYYLMALAGLMMASCSEDNDPFPGGGGDHLAVSRQLTFVFPGTAQGVVPYSATASEAENELKTLDIYVFGEDSLSADSPKPMVLEEIFRSGEGYDLNISADSKTATISVPAGNNKAFFFVANGREHLSLDSLVLHETDTTLFKAKMSNTLKGHIACPMLMSGQKNLPDVASAITDAAGNGIDVDLVRRMARFDIRNNSETSRFVIQTVVLDNVPANVPLFPIDGYEAPLLEGKMPVIDFTALANSNAGETNSVFYLYPTAKTDGTGLSLSLAGKDLVTNAAQVLPVTFKNYTAAAEGDPFISIEANNRYLVMVEDMGFGELSATLTVKEWVSGDTVNVNTGDGTIKLSADEGVGLEDNTLSVDAEPTLTDSVTINVAADGEWKLVVDEAAKDWIGVSEIPSGEVQKAFKVTTLLPNPSSKEARQGVVMVQNVRRPSIRQPLIVKQAAQDETTGRYLDLSGAAVAGNLLSFSGEKKDSINVSVAAPAGTAWTATKAASADWFTFGKEATGLRDAAGDGSNFEGSGPAVFSIVPTANATENERVDTVTITIAQGGAFETDLVQKLVVRQAARNLGSIQVACIGLSKGNVNIPADGFADENATIDGHTGERQVKVKATTEWKVVIQDGATWLTLEQVNGSDYTYDDEGVFNGYFMLKATAQAAGAEARSAKVTIVNTVDDKIFQEITFSQAAGAEIVVPDDELTLAQTSLVWESTDAAGVGKSIDVTAASSDWSLSGVPTWLTATANNGDVDTDITLTTTGDAPTDTDFKATITVTVGEKTEKITVTWKAPTTPVE